jgi:hypothetical protein
MLALFARHVVAPSVLLDRALTKRTLLRVALYPVSRLTVVAALFEPHLRDGTHNRPVVVLDRASETKLVLFPSETEIIIIIIIRSAVVFRSSSIVLMTTGNPASAA